MSTIEIPNRELKRRVIDLSFKHKLSHLGSCLTALDIIKDIYDEQKPGDKFVLDQGHAHLAHLVVKEALGLLDAEKMLKKYGIHCSIDAGCDCSTGSLGLGFGIALGMAMADPEHKVRVLTSDGAISEGIVYETLNTMSKYNVANFVAYLNANGWEGYGSAPDLVDIGDFIIYETNVNYLPFLDGLAGHYHVMNQQEYEQAMQVLS